MTNRTRSLLLVALVLSLTGVAQAVPLTITAQGYLTDSSGGSSVPADGIYSMQFDLYDAPFGGTLVAAVGPLNVTVSNGLYNARLPVPPAAFDGSVRYLQIRVNNQDMLPRHEVVSVPYAILSETSFAVVDDAIDSAALATGAVTLDALGIVCGDGEVLVYTVGAGWSCDAAGGPPQSVCDPSMYVHCYSGPPTTEGVGACRSGRADCEPDRSGFGSCTGEMLPTAETCANGVDDDCDGATDCADQSCATDPVCGGGCPDNDADGFSDAACGGTDCDDTNAQVNPAANEICNNGVDDDCDGDFDCADQSCATDPVCGGGCPDNDADGFSDAACGGTDCDDTNPQVNPAANEICNNGVDDDCDGDFDCADQSCAGAPGC